MRTTTIMACAGVLASITMCISAPAAADDGKNFTSKTQLSAAQEVQDVPVVSDGRARATIRFARDFSLAKIRVRFSNLEGQFTRIHFHCNVAGANGPIAIGLIDTVAPAFDNSDVVFLDGRRIDGTITNAQFPDEDPCPGFINRPVNNIASLAAAIEEGQIYWNIHTDVFPAGEVRGQARPLAAADD